MYGKVGVFMVAALDIMGCAQIIGIEDLPPLLCGNGIIDRAAGELPPGADQAAAPAAPSLAQSTALGHAEERQSRGNTITARRVLSHFVLGNLILRDECLPHDHVIPFALGSAPMHQRIREIAQPCGSMIPLDSWGSVRLAP